MGLAGSTLDCDQMRGGAKETSMDLFIASEDIMPSLEEMTGQEGEGRETWLQEGGIIPESTLRRRGHCEH